MKIIKLKAENFKRLKAVEIVPKGNTVVLSGKNAQGKTSVLDAIWAALDGGKAMKKTKEPIRKGTKKATVTLEMEDLTVTRKWTSNAQSYLSVESSDGKKYKSPQAVIDEFLGRLTFDPMEFKSMDSKERRDTLLGLIDIDLNALDNRKKEIFDRRTLTNRKVKEIESKMTGFPEFPDDLPDRPVSAAVILEEQKINSDIARDNQRVKDDYELCQQQIAEMEGELTEHMEKVEALKTNIAKAKNDFKNFKVQIEELMDPEEIDYSAKLEAIEEINMFVQKRAQLTELSVEHDKVKTTAQKLTDDIDKILTEKQVAIENADFPITGLNFDEDEVLYNDLPFDQASDAEQLAVSLAIAMAFNPKLKILRIRDGSLIDSTSRKIIKDMVKDKDYQVWIEVVDETGKMGFYIEDGEVKTQKGDKK